MNTWEDLRLRGIAFLIIQYSFTIGVGNYFFCWRLNSSRKYLAVICQRWVRPSVFLISHFYFLFFFLTFWVSASLYHLPLQQVRTDNSCQRCGLAVYRCLLKLDRGLNKFGQELHMILRAFPTWHLTVVCTCPGNHFYLPCPRNASLLLSPSHTQSILKLSLAVLSFCFYEPFSKSFYGLSNLTLS